MTDSEKLLVFLCSGTAKSGDKKLSYRIARQLEQMGIATIGTLQHLSEQHTISADERKNMLFINDCRAACVKVLTQGFDHSKFLFLDVSPFIMNRDFDVDQYIAHEILPGLREKWVEVKFKV